MLQNTNYPALRRMYDTYKPDGFNLLAFPCNQFGGQAPGSSEEERAWAFRKFGFEFDVFVSGWAGGRGGGTRVRRVSEWVGGRGVGPLVVAGFDV